MEAIHGAGQTVTALRNITFAIQQGDLCVVVGLRLGKSTLLSLIAGFAEPSEGTILLDGREVEHPGRDQASSFKGGLSPGCGRKQMWSLAYVVGASQQLAGRKLLENISGW